MLGGSVGPSAGGEWKEWPAGQMGASVGPIGGSGADGQHAEAGGLQMVGGAALVGENNGDPAGKGFGQDHAEGFIFSRVDENVDPAEKFLGIGASEQGCPWREGADNLAGQGFGRAAGDEHGPS